MRSTRWWESLSVQDRRALTRRLRFRDDVVVARFEESDHPDEPVPSDFYEYLVAHEVYLEDGRSFHICSAHERARNTVESGRIPHDFQCPLAAAACHLRRLLSVNPGRDCVLRLAQRPGGSAR